MATRTPRPRTICFTIPLLIASGLSCGDEGGAGVSEPDIVTRTLPIRNGTDDTTRKSVVAVIRR
ncbi:MAG: hypothetical protein AAGI01_13710, partial [Myxococcota bacterium]